MAAGGLVLQSCAHGVAAMPPPGAPLPPPTSPGLTGGLEVRGPRFVKDGKPFFVSGFNYWAGPTLGRDGNTAGWDQVKRDLDGLQAAGINMIRVMGATEGPDTEPFRIVPTIQPALGQYDPAGIGGVVRFADELKRRGMFGIFTMNNFWQWSGGFAQYLAWAGQGPIPYPPPAPNGSWDRFQHFCGSFYKNSKAVEGYRAYLQFVVPRLKDNPMVIWELANEPRGMRAIGAYRDWIDSTAKLIKSLAPGQLVTTGSEGQTQTPSYAGLDVVKDHESPAIDFICFHMWAANWGWVHKGSLEREYPKALAFAKKYVNDHAQKALKVGKPILLEEFGFPRDADSYDARFADHPARQVLRGGLRHGRGADPDHADGGDHALGLGGRQPSPAAGAVLEAGRSVHRRSTPRGAGLVQHLRQGHDAEAHLRVVAEDRRRGRGGGAHGGATRLGQRSLASPGSRAPRCREELGDWSPSGDESSGPVETAQLSNPNPPVGDVASLVSRHLARDVATNRGQRGAPAALAHPRLAILGPKRARDGPIERSLPRRHVLVGRRVYLDANEAGDDFIVREAPGELQSDENRQELPPARQNLRPRFVAPGEGRRRNSQREAAGPSRPDM